MKIKNILLLAAAAVFCVGGSSFAEDLQNLRIYINPGHGGHDSDDRNVVVPPFASGDANGFWESNASLTKGFAMRDLLKSFNTTTMMSRTTNTTDDDRNLHEIGYEANNFGADFFFAIHSNATGTSTRVNQPLVLFRGYTDSPQTPASKEMAIILNKHLLENRVTSWSSEKQWVAGDFTFYTNWSDGLGVLRKLTGPGLLSEGSYHDYIPETYRLLNADYCWLEGYHFTKAIMEYFNTTERYTTGVVAGMAYDSHLLRTGEIYNNIFHGHDEALPLCGATINLINAQGETVETYTTDELYNGVFMFKAVEPGNYKLQVVHSDYQPYEKEITVTADNVTYINPVVDHIRNTAPEVVTYSPVWAEGDDDVICNAPIEIKFNWDMDTESVENNFTITPAVDGKITWEESKFKLVFKPTRAYDTNTLYTVTIGKDAKHPGNITMGKDFTFQFRTADYNKQQVIASSPSAGALVHYEKPYVEFRFDHRPNTETIQNDIIVTDDAGEQVTYSVRTKKTSSATDPYGYFQIRLSKNLEIGKTYTINVPANVRDIQDIPIEAPYSFNFKAVDASQDNLAVVSSLDEAGLIAADNDGSVGISKLTSAVNTSTKLDGTSSYKLDYTFDDTTIEAIKTARYTVTGVDAAFTSANCVGLKVYGDLSTNDLYATFTGDNEDSKEVKLCNLDFLGWKDISLSLADVLAAGNYTLTSLEVRQANTVIGGKGTLYVDKLSKGAASDASVDAITSTQFRIYPNPASELLIANGNGEILGLQLISLSGKKVAEASGNVLNVSEIESGLYLVNIVTAGKTEIQKVMIAH